MSQLPSKFETLLETIRNEPAESTGAGPAEALAALRTTVRRRPSARPIRWAALTAAIAMGITLSVTMWPRPSEAARLLAILQQPFLGVVKQERTTIWDGVKSEEVVYWNGEVARTIADNGSETRYEQDRIIIRHPQGYFEIRQVEGNPSFIVRMLDVPKLLRSPGANVKRSVSRSGETFVVVGQMVDGQGIQREYTVVVRTDQKGRPVLQSISHRGLGETNVVLSYGHPNSALELSPVGNSRMYNLESQRKDLFVRLEDYRKDGKVEEAIGAFVDEQGNAVVLTSVADGFSMAGDLIFVAGAKLATRSTVFNKGVSLAGSQANQPYTYKGLPVLAQTFEPKTPLRAPFELQFPLWRQDHSAKATHLLYDPNQPGTPRLIGTRRVQVKNLIRTSSIYTLLAPSNVPIYADPSPDDGQDGPTSANSGR